MNNMSGGKMVAKGEIPAPVAEVLSTARKLLRKFEFWREEDHENERFSAAWSLTFATEPDEIDGGYTAWIKELPGCVSDGDTEEDALANLAEALQGVLTVRLNDAPVNHEPDECGDGKVTTRQVAFG